MSDARDPHPVSGRSDAFEREPWSTTRTLHDGTVVTLRPLSPADKEGLRDAFHTLSPETRYMRFFSVVTEPTEAVLRYLTDVDQVDHVAIVAIASSLDLKSERGVGLARFVRVKGEPHVAEAAVTVVDEFQRRGLGVILLIELTRAALARGVKVFRGEVLSSNVPMLSILSSVGAKLEPIDEPPHVDSLEDLDDVPSLRRGGASLYSPSLRFEVALESGEPDRPHGLLHVVRVAAEAMSERLRELVGGNHHEPPAKAH